MVLLSQRSSGRGRSDGIALFANRKTPQADEPAALFLLHHLEEQLSSELELTSVPG